MHRSGDEEYRVPALPERKGESLSHSARAEYRDTRSRHAITPWMGIADTIGPGHHCGDRARIDP
jgi:hypothetical protein